MNSTYSVTLLIGCLLSQVALADEPVAFKITLKKMEDKVVIQQADDQSIFAIASPSGIGSATIERKHDHWDKHVRLRLHLKGLESLSISNGKTTLSVAVSSHNDKQRIRLWKDKREEEPLDEKHELWMEVRSIGSDGKASHSIPVKDGYFEFELPKGFLRDNPKTIAIQWIDFYR